MKISVITVVFNGAKWIEGCMRSVAEQNYADREHIIIDGLSTDGTIDIVKSAALKHPYIRFFSEKDSGIYDAMNRALEKSSGEYVIFLGADDRLAAEDVLQQASDELCAQRPDVLYGDVRIYGGQIGAMKPGDVVGGEFDLARLLERNICHQAIFYSRGLIDKVGPFRTDYRLYSDWDYNLRCWSIAKFQYKPFVVCDFCASGAGSTGTDVPFLMNFLDDVRRLFQVSLFSGNFRRARKTLSFVGRQKLKKGECRSGLYYLVAATWHHFVCPPWRLAGS